MTGLNPRFTEAREVISHLSENGQLMALGLTATRIQPDKRKSCMLCSYERNVEECLQGPEWTGTLSCSQHPGQEAGDG